LVTKFSSVFDMVIPFFKLYPIYGVKAMDFLDFCKIASIMKEKKHLTVNGLIEIELIKEGMNTKRVY